MTTSDVLTEMGFALWIPTNDLSDALSLRRTAAEHDRHIFDCDTGSMILLTVADSLGMDAALVETTIPGHDPKEIVQHNYVQWRLGQSYLNWDVNARQACAAPTANQLPFQGRPLTKRQFWAYETSLRGSLWNRTGRYSEAVRDYQASIGAWPERPGAYNGLAWAVATKQFPEREALSDIAMSAALKASSVRPDAGIMDTLACMYAYREDYPNAISTEEKAIEIAPQRSVDDFKRRLGKFRASQNCDKEP
jgi:tetratricopeptide (TPR) repeat protein